MSEKLRQSAEHQAENLDLSAETERNRERINKEALEAASQTAEVEELQNIVESKAIGKKELGPVDREKNETYVPGLHKALKTEGYERSLKKIQSRLSAPERAASKIIHKPAVDTASNVLAGTVAKPSGILGAGIVSLVGSSILLYMAKYYGFTYNFFAFFVLLVAGYFLGVLLELFFRAFKKPGSR